MKDPLYMLRGVKPGFFVTLPLRNDRQYRRHHGRPRHRTGGCDKCRNVHAKCPNALTLPGVPAFLEPGYRFEMINPEAVGWMYREVFRFGRRRNSRGGWTGKRGTSGGNRRGRPGGHVGELSRHILRERLDGCPTYTGVRLSIAKRDRILDRIAPMIRPSWRTLVDRDGAPLSDQNTYPTLQGLAVVLSCSRETASELRQDAAKRLTKTRPRVERRVFIDTTPKTTRLVFTESQHCTRGTLPLYVPHNLTPTLEQMRATYTPSNGQVIARIDRMESRLGEALNNIQQTVQRMVDTGQLPADNTIVREWLDDDE